jgi:hypothetical protein
MSGEAAAASRVAALDGRARALRRGGGRAGNCSAQRAAPSHFWGNFSRNRGQMGANGDMHPKVGGPLYHGHISDPSAHVRNSTYLKSKIVQDTILH